jgi:hypothetical protein
MFFAYNIYFFRADPGEILQSGAGKGSSFSLDPKLRSRAFALEWLRNFAIVSNIRRCFHAYGHWKGKGEVQLLDAAQRISCASQYDGAGDGRLCARFEAFAFSGR